MSAKARSELLETHLYPRGDEAMHPVQASLDLLHRCRVADPDMIARAKRFARHHCHELFGQHFFGELQRVGDAVTERGAHVGIGVESALRLVRANAGNLAQPRHHIIAPFAVLGEHRGHRILWTSDRLKSGLLGDRIVSISTSTSLNVSSSASTSQQDARHSTNEITRKASSRSKKEHKVSFKVASASGTEDQDIVRCILGKDREAKMENLVKIGSSLSVTQ